jgi:hypothetical protein
MTQCSSCGGFCGRVCQRDNTKALELACYYQNRCCDLEEIIELFCMDAEEQNKPVQWTPPATVFLTTPKPNPLTGWEIT